MVAVEKAPKRESYFHMWTLRSAFVLFAPSLPIVENNRHRSSPVRVSVSACVLLLLLLLHGIRPLGTDTGQLAPL